MSNNFNNDVNKILKKILNLNNKIFVFQTDIFRTSIYYKLDPIIVAKKIINLLGLTENEENYLDTNYERPGQDVRYAIDDTKIKSLGWEPKANFDDELVKIVKYYKENFIW